MNRIQCPLCGKGRVRSVARRFNRDLLVRCRGCRHVFLAAMPAAGETETLYRQEYFHSLNTQEWLAKCEEWVKSPTNTYQTTLRWFGENAGGIGGKKTIDIGCGVGRFLLECLRQGADATGLEPSREAVRLAKEHYGISLLNATLEEAGARGLIRNGSFDAVFMFELIEHVTQPRPFLQAAAALLKPGGYLVVSTPNFLIHKLYGAACEDIQGISEHVQFFEPQVLSSLLCGSGMSVRFLTTTEPEPFGDQMQTALRQQSALKGIWAKMRGIPLVRRQKERMFSLLNRIRRKEDRQGLSGAHILCVAQKP